jgi:hypothetical protein
VPVREVEEQTILRWFPHPSQVSGPGRLDLRVARPATIGSHGAL